MIRAAFFACGLFVTLCGVATVFVDRVELTDYASRRLRRAVAETSADAPALRLIYSADATGSPDRREVVDPPDWAGFGVLSAGAVTLLYSLCLPGRRPPEEEEDD